MTQTQTDTPGNTTQARELLTVIVPCLNEEGAIEGTVLDILRVAAELPLEVRLLLIDDGSTDGTREKMEALCGAHPACSMAVNPKNLGVGRSVLNSYQLIEPGSWVTVMPGDNEIMFESIRYYLQLRHDYDVILGYLQNPVIRTLPRRLASWAFCKIVNTLYGFPYRYLNGLKMYRVEAFRGIPVISGGHAFNAELLAKAQLRNPLLRIGEAPFANRGRARGATKAFRPKAIVRAIRELILGYRSVAAYREREIMGKTP